MKLNELLKNFNLQLLFTCLIIIVGYQATSFGALKHDDYVVHIFFRDFYDRKGNKYDQKSPFNTSGFSENIKWDSISRLATLVQKQKPKASWLDNSKHPHSMIVQFTSEKEAQSFYDDLTTNKENEYSFIIETAAIKKYIPH